MATKPRLWATFLCFAILLTLYGCGGATDTTIPADAQLSAMSGGELGTIFDTTEDAYSKAIPGVTGEERDQFLVGRFLFRQNWLTAGSAVEGRDGLGPVFNARSCIACHFRDGRSAPPNAGEPFLALLLRLSIPGTDSHGGPLDEPTYGGQLQNFVVPTDNISIQAEGTPQVTFSTISGQFGDGETYELAQPHFTIQDLMYGAMDPSTMISPRTAPPMIGLGLLEDVPESEILKNADANDQNGDGISGRPNYVWDVEDNRTKLGRFGWKANQPTLRQQVAGAFLGDIGITSSTFPNENHSRNQSALSALPSGGNPELTELILSRVTTYVRNLAVPGRRDIGNSEVKKGENLFYQAKCTACHSPQLRSSKGIIRPFTDMLLHDMGPGLADNRPDFEADGQEWRTPPLWGIGLVEKVNGHTRFLHDGRARNLQEAILWHGGEATASKEAFRTMSRSDRTAMIKFLNSL